jgi:hypothetical protein
MTGPGSQQSAKTSVMETSTACDDRVLELRVQGRSFAGIATTLGLVRPSRANEAFNRALRRKPMSERDGIRRQELVRLDVLADGVRADAALAPKDKARRLRTVDRLRTMLMEE